MEELGGNFIIVRMLAIVEFFCNFLYLWVIRLRSTTLFFNFLIFETFWSIYAHAVLFSPVEIFATEFIPWLLGSSFQVQSILIIYCHTLFSLVRTCVWRFWRAPTPIWSTSHGNGFSLLCTKDTCIIISSVLNNLYSNFIQLNLHGFVIGRELLPYLESRGVHSRGGRAPVVLCPFHCGIMNYSPVSALSG